MQFSSGSLGLLKQMECCSCNNLTAVPTDNKSSCDELAKEQQLLSPSPCEVCFYVQQVLRNEAEGIKISHHLVASPAVVKRVAYKGVGQDIAIHSLHLHLSNKPQHFRPSAAFLEGADCRIVSDLTRIEPFNHQLAEKKLRAPPLQGLFAGTDR